MDRFYLILPCLCIVLPSEGSREAPMSGGISQCPTDLEEEEAATPPTSPRGGASSVPAHKLLR
jgi:hypothetical protein